MGSLQAKVEGIMSTTFPLRGETTYVVMCLRRLGHGFWWALLTIQQPAGDRSRRSGPTAASGRRAPGAANNE